MTTQPNTAPESRAPFGAGPSNLTAWQPRVPFLLQPDCRHTSSPTCVPGRESGPRAREKKLARTHTDAHYANTNINTDAHTANTNRDTDVQYANPNRNTDSTTANINRNTDADTINTDTDVPPHMTQSRRDENKVIETTTHGTKLNIIQINLHKSKAATIALSQTLIKYNIHVALLNEPHVYKNKISHIPKGYQAIIPTTTEQPRASIIVKSNLNWFSLPELNSKDAVAIMIDSKNIHQQIILAAIYEQPNYNTPPPSREMVNIFSYAKTKNKQIIAGCDSNSHHQMWGSRKTNRRGTNLAEYISSENLLVMNTGDTPTFQSANGSSIIDITICNMQAQHNAQNWKVLEDESLSDHRYIYCETSQNYDRVTPKHNPRKTDWTKFRTTLRGLLPVSNPFPASTTDIEKMTESLTTALTIAFKRSTPTPRVTEKATRTNPWWTNELTQLKQRTKQAQRKHHKTKSDADYARYRALKSEYARIIQKEKRSSFQKYATNIESLPEAQRLMKTLQNSNTGKIGILKNEQGNYTGNIEETITLLLNTHFPGNKSTEEETETQITNDTSVTNWHKTREIIDKEIILWAINSFQPYKSPGLDGIHPITLQKSADIISDHLEDIFRGSLFYGHIPERWKTSSVIFIPKPGKPNYEQPKSFRPISLTSFLLKTLERIIDKRLRETVLTSFPIHRNQHAYQNGRSTETALHCLISKIEDAYEKNQYALGAFFDIQGAFDNAPYKAILKSLKRRYTPDMIQNWTRSLLLTRKVQVEIGNSSRTVKATKGCPQGGVLSPLLWSLVVDELLNIMHNNDIYTQAYSDDGTILLTGSNITELSNTMQTALNEVQEWCKNNDLSISPEKTELILFTRKRKIGNWTEPHLNGTQLARKEEVKYLGVTLDTKLNFTSHITNKCEKATRILFQVRNIIAKKWGLKPKIVRWIYTTLVRTMISYGSVIWWERTITTGNKAKLQKIQRLAEICITGALKTTPNASLNIICDLKPLHIHIIEEAMKSYIRIASWEAWRNQNQNGHKSIKRIAECVIGCNTDEIDKCKKRTIHDHKYDTRTANEITKIRNPTLKFTIATNTGKYKHTARIICETTGTTRELNFDSDANITLCELNAIIEICNDIKRHKHDTQAVVIQTSNNNTFKQLTELTSASKTTIQCIYTLNNLSETHITTIQKIPHNENIARCHTVQETQRDNVNITRVSNEEIRKKITDWGYQQLYNELRNSPGYHISKETLGKRNYHQNKPLYHRTRISLSRITAVLTGHAQLNKHLYRMKQIDTPICALCNTEEEDLLHFLFDCPELAEIRTKTLGQIPRGLSTIRHLGVEKILDYIDQTGRLS